MKIPYGESNFTTIIKEGYFYQDRTEYIRILEETVAKYIYYLRPRRFGKSLFVSMLHHYYGLEHKEGFKNLFGKLAIGKKPTPLANKYMVLRFDFSHINRDTDENTFNGFLKKVKEGVSVFLKTYFAFFPATTYNSVLDEKKPNEMLQTLFSHCTSIQQKQALPKIYLLIDGYDFFLNKDIDNGLIRIFYESIKVATWNGIVDRLFITGELPISLDSMTSGFNIATNISLYPSFHAMMGFEQEEVRGILKGIGLENGQLTKTLKDLKTWYNGYLFTAEAKESVYNPSMLLYFVQQFQAENYYPDKLLDPNIASDYSKIRKLFKIQGREQQHLAVLNTLTESSEVTARLTIQFSLERTFYKDDLISLLFYMGFLTIKEKELGGFIFHFPNYVIERLYSEYFVAMLQEQKNLPIDNSDLNFAIREVAKYGNPKHLYEQVMRVVEAMSTRDSQGFNENSLKAIFVSLLQQQQFYYVHSEYESDRQYVDVFLETIRGHAVKYETAFELKYVKKGKKIKVKAELDKAEVQLRNYMISNKFMERPSLKAFVVLVHGVTLHERELEL